MSDRFLEQLLESPTKARVLRLFLNHPDEWIGSYDAARRIRSRKQSVKRQAEKLYKIGLLRRRTIRLSKDERSQRRGRTPTKERRYSVNKTFPFYEELQRFVLNSRPVTKKTLQGRVKKLGAVKLALLTGALVEDDVGRADVLIVGSQLREKRVKNLIETLEAEHGRSLRCVIMTTEQFEYRYGLFDRFVRDLVENKKEVLIDRLGVTSV